METRLAGKDDASVLATLHAESFGGARWTLAQIMDSLALASTCAFVACQDREPQGFIFCQIVAQEAEILTFCVSPASRRQGIGSLLLNAVLNVARQKDARRLFLEVASDNAPARALYEQSNFRVIGTRPNYYKRKDAAVDAVMMERAL